ncbi:uncharacterized protein LOC131929306 isoform X2 [Physella acuta]|uniref:uncharacterized protein LOC131929306 isoform X2 n=1 Tax=Physella acuta TaxID=109671 RepID=UPI0027DB41BB|nr:uncharacterized protein LOC131929306 isoform X2 [Physella acuta]
MFAEVDVGCSLRVNAMSFRHFLKYQMPLTLMGVLLVSTTLTLERRLVTFRTGAFDFGKCQIQGQYVQNLESYHMLDMTRSYSVGTRWQERCRNCSCFSLGGAWCTGPVCPTGYDFSQEKWCLKWSTDGCCCEELGCTIDGVQYTLGAWFPYGQGNPCLQCACQLGTSREHCLSQRCGTYELVCEGREVSYDANCCPHYHCPNAGYCDVIPDPFPATPGHELMDWYRRQLDPIPVGRSHHFHIDTWTTYVCSCPKNGTADCVMERLSGDG